MAWNRLCEHELSAHEGISPRIVQMLGRLARRRARRRRGLHPVRLLQPREAWGLSFCESSPRRVGGAACRCSLCAGTHRRIATRACPPAPPPAQFTHTHTHPRTHAPMLRRHRFSAGHQRAHKKVMLNAGTGRGPAPAAHQLRAPDGTTCRQSLTPGSKMTTWRAARRPRAAVRPASPDGVAPCPASAIRTTGRVCVFSVGPSERCDE